MADENLTTAGSHRATERGYAGGELIEPGKLVPAGVPVGSWMEPVGGKREPAPVDEGAAAAFDHDGDGRPGGAPKGGNRKA